MFRGVHDEWQAWCANSLQAGGTGFTGKSLKLLQRKNIRFVIQFFLVHLPAIAILGAVPKLERKGTLEAIHKDVSI